jgi:tetratricopeptide (TPR) repeat protein
MFECCSRNIVTEAKLLFEMRGQQPAIFVATGHLILLLLLLGDKILPCFSSSKNMAIRAEIDTLNNRLAMAYERQDWHTALKVLSKAAKLDPADAKHFLNRGGILQMLGPSHTKEAQVSFERASQVDPLSPIPYLHLAQLPPGT